MELLQVIQRCLDLSTRDHLMLRAACCLGFFGFLQAGEFTVNSVFDPTTYLYMTVDDLQADKVHIKCSKTDPFRVDCDIYVGRGIGSVCPVTALGSYLSLRGSAPRPQFMLSDGRPLTRQQLSSSVQSILHGAGYSGSYSGHSFHIGAATTAVADGVPDHLIKTLGRWSSDEYQIYIQTPVSSIVSVSSQLVA